MPRRPIERPGDRRSTRPLRPKVRSAITLILAVSPDGRTIPELQLFLVAQRPASRDTIARALEEMERDALIEVCDEPAWRRRARLRLVHGARDAPLRGRPHRLYVPTPLLAPTLRPTVTRHPSPPIS